MGDEYLDTVPATELDKFIKSSVKNFVLNPSESEGEYECDVPASFTTFSNVLFDADYDFNSGDDQSFLDEDFLKKIYSNPLFDEEIISMKIDQHPFNAESDLIEYMLNHDSSIIISSKIDSLFDKFSGELTLLKSISPGIDETLRKKLILPRDCCTITHFLIDSLLDEFADELTLLKSIPLGIDETDCDPKEGIHLIERLLYDNSSPRLPEEFVSKNSNADIISQEKAQKSL
nr:hypothetical protein [Tanacetum cinerariifolium]